MNHPDLSNPYSAPEAPLEALQVEFRRPPVFTAISLFCWVLGAVHLIGSAVCLYAFSGVIGRFGWRKAFLYLVWPTPRPSLIILSHALASVVYVMAGSQLWNRRGRTGLIFCALGIGCTYFFAWTVRPK